MSLRLAATTLALMLALPLQTRAAEAQPDAAVEVDANAEVAAVLFAASATQAALAKSADAKLRAQQTRIQELAAELKAGDRRHRAEMTAAQEAFVTDLAARDRDYAAQISMFRGTVTDIAATPEGARALERFNAGDELGALVILDRLRATNEQMRQARARLEDAAEGRRIAQLALEARTRGKLTTQAVIERFAGVVKLDPAVYSDWLELVALYRDAGQLDDARKAVDALAATAKDDTERARASAVRSEVLFQQGHVVESRAAAEEAVAISRRVAAASPGNAQLEINLSRSLISLGEVARRQADITTAHKVYTEAVAITRRRFQAEPGNILYRNKLASDLLHLTDAVSQLGDMPAARKALDENLSILRPLAAQNPESIVYPRRISVSLMWLSDTLVTLGFFNEAREANDEIIATSSRLSAADPANVILKRDLAYGLSKQEFVQRIEGDFASSLATTERTQQLFIEMARPADAALDSRLDESLGWTDISKVQYLLGDFDGALQNSTTSVEKVRKLVAADATDGTTRQYFATALYALGDALRAKRDFASARRAFEEGIKLDREMAAKSPDATAFQTDLSIGLLGIGLVEKAQGKNAAALKAMNESLEIRRKLAALHAGNSAAERAVAETMRELVELPGSRITWAAFREQVETMQRNGLFWPADKGWLEEVRTRAAGGSGTP
jgi:tetratricopeptide (TPR) repeat protein